jgi:hypothetical protein
MEPIWIAAARSPDRYEFRPFQRRTVGTEVKKNGRETTIWRIHIRPGGDDERGPALWKRSFDLCRKKGVLGVGWGVKTSKSTLTWTEYQRLAKKEYKFSRVDWSLRLLAEDVWEGDLIWARDIAGVYFLGRVTGPWAYVGKRVNVAADIVNVRPVRMVRVGVSRVPGRSDRVFPTSPNPPAGLESQNLL